MKEWLVIKMSPIDLNKHATLFPIIISSHKQEWSIWFQEEKSRIEKILKGLNIYRISHCGSTSIQNIKAKPIIDILIEVPKCDSLEAVKDVLVNNGYQETYRWKNSIVLFNGYTENGYADKVFHVHIRYQGDNDILYFRDYLNDYPDIAHLYEQLKLGLSEEFKFDRDSYTEAKSQFVAKYTAIAKNLYKDRYI